LLLGWAVGLTSGTTVAFIDGMKPVHTFVIGGEHYTVYTGLLALVFNIAAAAVAQCLRNMPIGVGDHRA
jgi:SSS family solute:Na+ symporter